MKIIEKFYFDKFYEALELGNDEMAEKMLKKGTWIQRQGEARSLAWVLFGVLVVTILSPFIQWWLVDWRHGL